MASDTVETTTLFDGAHLDSLEIATLVCARCHNLQRLPFSHKPHRVLIEMGLLCPPPRLVVGRTHFGNISNLAHASTEFSATISFRIEDRARANAGLAFEGKTE